MPFTPPPLEVSSVVQPSTPMTQNSFLQCRCRRRRRCLDVLDARTAGCSSNSYRSCFVPCFRGCQSILIFAWLLCSLLFMVENLRCGLQPLRNSATYIFVRFIIRNKTRSGVKNVQEMHHKCILASSNSALLLISTKIILSFFHFHEQTNL